MTNHAPTINTEDLRTDIEYPEVVIDAYDYGSMMLTLIISIFFYFLMLRAINRCRKHLAEIRDTLSNGV